MHNNNKYWGMFFLRQFSLLLQVQHPLAAALARPANCRRHVALALVAVAHWNNAKRQQQQRQGVVPPAEQALVACGVSTQTIHPASKCKCTKLTLLNKYLITVVVTFIPSLFTVAQFLFWSCRCCSSPLSSCCTFGANTTVLRHFYRSK